MHGNNWNTPEALYHNTTRLTQCHLQPLHPAPQPSRPSPPTAFAQKGCRHRYTHTGQACGDQHGASVMPWIRRNPFGTHAPFPPKESPKIVQHEYEAPERKNRRAKKLEIGSMRKSLLDAKSMNWKDRGVLTAKPPHQPNTPRTLPSQPPS